MSMIDITGSSLRAAALRQTLREPVRALDEAFRLLGFSRQ